MDDKSNYMAERGFSIESVDAFDLKVHPDEGRIGPVAAWIIIAAVTVVTVAVIVAVV